MSSSCDCQLVYIAREYMQGEIELAKDTKFL